MRRVTTIAFVLALLSIGCGEPHLLPEGERARLNQEEGLIASESPLKGCQNHVATHDARFMAEQLGISEREVPTRYGVNLWASPPPEGRRVASQLIPGAQALIVEEQEDAYRVRNPVDQTVGWVGRREVARTVRLDVATLQPC